MAALVSAACGGGGPLAVEPPPTAVLIEFRLRGHGADQAFHFRTSSAALIAQARAQLELPPEQRTLFPSGPIAAGDGGFNAPWGWHHTELSLVEVAIELCDGWPGFVQSELGYWLGTVRQFCPWSGYVHAVTGAS